MNKLLSILLFVFLLCTAVACAPTPNQQPHKTYEEQKALYGDVIAQYSALLSAKYNGEEPSAPNTDGLDERETDIAKALHGIVDSCKDAKEAEELGYGFKDMDGDGTIELILLTRYTSIQAIFTISESLPILLEANYGSRTSFQFASDNRFFMARHTVTDGIEESTFYTCRVEGDKMVYDAVYGSLYDQEKREIIERFQMIEGERTPINEEAFDELYREQKKTQVGYSSTSKLLAPRIYFPLAESESNQDLPMADFSSYAAILKTYKTISTCLDKFDSSEWIAGKYDGLFAFPNEISFEYYTRLLLTAYHSNGLGGYDEIDLNGDGQDELVLMNEDYRIKAIFTQRNGSPVLLDAFSIETCWLDDQGFIHVDREDYYELEYSLYEFTKSGDYNLIYSILVEENGNRYLTKNGKTQRISFEESLELYYDDYCRYSEPFEPNEQTKNVSRLTYTPLTKTSEDFVKDAVETIWHKYAKLEKTTGKELSFSNTYVTFENVTDTQMDLNIKYAFTYYYPDPNQEDYYLDDTIESSLKLTARKEDGVFVFNEHGLKGRFEFGQEYLWIIIEASTDERFPVGNHCYGQDSSGILKGA